MPRRYLEFVEGPQGLYVIAETYIPDSTPSDPIVLTAEQVEALGDPRLMAALERWRAGDDSQEEERIRRSREEDLANPAVSGMESMGQFEDSERRILERRYQEAVERLGGMPGSLAPTH